MASKKKPKKKGLTRKSTRGKVAKTLKKSSLKKKSQSKKFSSKASSSKINDFPIAAIGASAGGFEALEQFFENMPANPGMSFVIVAHLSPNHVSLLPELLQKHTSLKVAQAEDNSKIRLNNVYVIPPKKDLAIFKGKLQLMEPKSSRGVHLSIDSFFKSIAEDLGNRSIGIVLSGTGTDGTQGIKAIKGEMGMTMAQSENSAKYPGMPTSAISTGLVDFVLPVEQMPGKLINYCNHLYDKKETGVEVINLASSDLSKIYLLLRQHTGHDFSLYKKNTICRRIERRMHVQQINKFSDYVHHLQESHRELDVLFKELLIGVTSFFRDPLAFDILQKKHLPDLLENHDGGQVFRVWVPGCSTGEEVYSIAILINETMEKMGLHFSVQIFATDIDERAINSARVGFFPSSISTDIMPDRLNRYFLKENLGYRIKKIIREMIVFAPQDLIKDPPFTNLNMISCRNLLIYMESKLQKKILPLFHYSLKPDGLLFLGSSESIGQYSKIFTPLDKKWKLFKSVPNNKSSLETFELLGSKINYDSSYPEVPEKIQQTEDVAVINLIKAILKQSLTPPSAIINENGDLLYIHGKTGDFLEPPEGRFSPNIIEMARNGLKGELSSAIKSVNAENQECIISSIKVLINGGYKNVDITVKPLSDKPQLRGKKIVIFQEVLPRGKGKGKSKNKIKNSALKSLEYEQLELKLKNTRENLQSTIEELETSNEELKSTNEELQSTNEELQSTNEELETSREELQSLNEESTTVNVELQDRIDDLSLAHDDIKNLLDSTHIATIFLDTDLNIRKFTPQAIDIIPFTTADIGRPIDHLVSKLLDQNIFELSKKVLNTLDKIEKKVKSKDNEFYKMKIRPYRTTGNIIAGVVITFENITELVQKNELLEEINNKRVQLQRLSTDVLNTFRDPILILDENSKVIQAGRSFYDFFRTKKEVTLNKSIYELGQGHWNIPNLKSLIEKTLKRKKNFEKFEVTHKIPKIGKKSFLLNGRYIDSKKNENKMILLVFEEINKK